MYMDFMSQWREYQLYYILIQKRYRNCLKNAKAYPGADINSDHNLVVGEIQVKLKKVWRGETKDKLNIEDLKEPNNELELEKRFTENLEKSKEGEGINEKWIKIRDRLMTAAK